MTQKLFSELKLGDLVLTNRIVMAPMTRSRSTGDHVPIPLMAEYYGSRADAGLLITEGTAPDGNGCGYPRIPGIWNDEQVEAWKPITQAVHKGGGKIALQLMHTGRIGHPNNMPEGARLLSASAVQAAGEMYTDQEGPKAHPVPEEMNAADIEVAIEGYVSAAQNALKAGFDLVELHGANGYLIDQFISPNVNQRTDEFGGDIKGRGKFALEVARRTAEAISADKVGIRLSPFGVFNAIEQWDTISEDFTWLATELGKLKLAYLHLVDHSGMGAPPVPAEIKQDMRRAFGGPLILSGNYDGSSAEKDLTADKGELVAFGRPFLANPDLVTRLDKGIELNAPDMSTFYTPGEKGYTDYPLASS